MIVADIVRGVVSDVMSDAIKNEAKSVHEEKKKEEDVLLEAIRKNRMNPLTDYRTYIHNKFLDDLRKHPWKLKFFFLTGAIGLGFALFFVSRAESFTSIPSRLQNFLLAAKDGTSVAIGTGSASVPGALVYPALTVLADLLYATGTVVREICSKDLKESRENEKRKRYMVSLAEKAGPVEKASLRSVNELNQFIFIRNGDMRTLSMDMPVKYIEIPDRVQSMKNPVFADNTPEVTKNGKTIIIPHTCMEVAFDKIPGNIACCFDSVDTMQRLCKGMQFRTNGEGGGTYLYNGKAVTIEGETYFSHIAWVDRLNGERDKDKDWWSDEPKVNINNPAIMEARKDLRTLKKTLPDYEDRKKLADDAWKETKNGNICVGEFLAILKAAGIPESNYRKKARTITLEDKNIEGEYDAWFFERKKSDRPKGYSRVHEVIRQRQTLVKERQEDLAREKERLDRESREKNREKHVRHLQEMGKKKRKGYLRDIQKKEGSHEKQAVEEMLRTRTEAHDIRER